jgi:hypothetical protein
MMNDDWALVREFAGRPSAQAFAVPACAPIEMLIVEKTNQAGQISPSGASLRGAR